MATIMSATLSAIPIQIAVNATRTVRLPISTACTTPTCGWSYLTCRHVLRLYIAN